MVSQTMISFKVDTSQLEEFDRTCSGLGIKRNKLLNFMVFYANRMFRDFDKFRIMNVYDRCFYSEFMGE